MVILRNEFLQDPYEPLSLRSTSLDYSGLECEL